MSGILEFYNKAKKKLYDTAEGVGRAADPYRKKVIEWGNNPTNTPNWLKKTDSGLRSFSQSAENTPKFNFSERVDNPIGRFGASIAQETLNIPSRMARATFRDYGKISTNPSYLLKRGSEAAGIGVDAGSLFAGGGAAKTLAKEGFKKAGRMSLMGAVKQGAKTGAKEGLAYGAVSGALSGAQEGENLKEQGRNALKQGAIGGVMGAVAGGVLGGTIKGAGHEIGSIKKDIFNYRNPYSKRVVTKYAKYEPVEGVFVGPDGQNQMWPDPNSAYKVVETVKLPFKPQSATGKLLTSRPGLSLENVNNRRPKVVSTDELIAQKRARARALVGKQIDNQKAKLDTAEKGFVPPQRVKAPEKRLPIVPKNTDVPFKGDIPFNQEFPDVGKVIRKPLPSIEEFVEGKTKTTSTPKDKKMAKALGLPEDKIPTAEPFNEDYNFWQKKAYKEKGERIKSIGEVLNVPKNLSAAGYSKKEWSVMSPSESKFKSRMLELGYPKNIIDELDAQRAAKLAENNVKYGKLPPHIVERYSKNNDLPRYSNEDIRDTAGLAQYSTLGKEGKNDFRRMVGEWIGEREASKTSGMKKGIKYREIPQEIGWDVIDKLEHPEEVATPAATHISQMLKKEMDDLHQEATRSGMKVGYWWDYFPHIWKETPEHVQEVIKGAGRKFKFSNERDIPTYREGINMGLTPKYNHPAPILAEYVSALEKTKANIKFINNLKNKGYIVDATVGERQPGFLPLTGPGFPKSMSNGPEGEKLVGYYYAPKDIAEKINNIFSPPENGLPGKTLDRMARISGGLQDITLSGGIPKTPVNAWTIAQTTKEVLSGRITSPVASAFRALSGKWSNNFFESNADQIIKMQKAGIPMDSSFNAGNLMDEGFWKNAFAGTEPGLVNTLKSIWHKTTNEPTFKRFMPMLQVNLFNDIERKALKAGKEANEAAQIAANAVKNFYGVTDAGTNALRSKIGKDATGTFFFAPRYRESMINFWGNNLKSMIPVNFSRSGIGMKKNWWLENQTNLKFSIGAALAYAGYNEINKSLTGRDLKDNPPGMEDKLLIPLGNGKVVGVPFLSSIATMPRLGYRVGKSLARGDLETAGKDAFQGLVSMSVKPIADVVANSDYFGNEIYDKEDGTNEKLKKQGEYLLKQYGLAHPYTKAIFDSEGKPGYQIASEAMEMPFRFYDEDKLASREFWEKKTEAEMAHNKFRELAKTDTAKANEFYSQNRELIDNYPKLNDMDGMHSALKKSGEKDKFGGIVKDMGFSLVNTAHASDGAETQPEIETNGMGSGAQKIIRNFEIEKAKEELANSSDNFRDLGDIVLRKSEDGKVLPMRKDSFTARVLTEKMENQKRSENIEGWMKTAESKLELMTKMLQDPSFDDLDKMTIENDMETLEASYQKYAEYGGFTKPKKGRKLEEKFRYPLVDPEFMKIQMLIGGMTPRKIRIQKRPLPFVRRRRTPVRRRKLLR